MMVNEIKNTIKQAKRIIGENKNRFNSKYAGVLRLDNFVENVELFWQRQPFFFDKSGSFWFWNMELKFWELVDEVDLMCKIDLELNFFGQCITNGLKNNYLNAFRHVGRRKKPKDPPKTWIQFREKIFDVATGKIVEASPEFFICNPIPYELGDSEDTPVLDKLFNEWVGKKYVSTLYEIIAYCCLCDYPIHCLFCMVGCGRNGKSQFQKVISHFIGNQNTCSTELDLLIENRFESAKLFKRLVCTLGETNFGVLSKTSLLKKLTGGDLIGYEFKNKLPFDGINYAKIIISSNALPSSLDTSDGFYRRWMILMFNNEFQEGKDVIDIIPEQEYNALALKITRILPELLKRGSFTNQGTIEERKKAYILASNPLPVFLASCCLVDSTRFIKYGDLYNAYTEFLIKRKKRKVSRKEFSEILAEEGYFSSRNNKKVADYCYESGYYIDGLALRDDWKLSIYSELCDLCDVCAVFPTREKQLYKGSGKGCTNVTNVTKNEDLSLKEGDILFHIEKFGQKGVMGVSQLVEDLSSGVEPILAKMLKKGELFEPFPGKVKAL